MHKIIIDSREGKLKEIINDDNISFEQLNVGDAQIVNENNEVLCIIERKTWSDLSSSIKDNRYHEQKSRLLASNCKCIVYLIEGNISCQHRSLPKNTLLSCLIGASLRDNISVFYTQNHQDTLHYIQLIMSKLEKMNLKGSEDTHKSIIQQMSSKKEKYSNMNIWYAQLACIDGVSFSLAQNIANVYPNYRCLYEKYCETQNIKFLTQIPKIGKVLANKIIQSMVLQDTHP